MISLSALLDIDQVSQLTGLPPATLRNWEKRYGFPKPQRSQGGHRLFRVEDVEKIRQVAALSSQGVKVSEAIEKVHEGAPAVQNLQNIAPAVHTLNECLDKILQALYRYDANGADEVLSKIGMRLSETDLLEMVYPNLLRKTGEDWESSRINIAQEHFASNYFRTHLLSYFKAGRVGRQGPKVLMATPPGERHEGGLLILSAYMMLLGWRVYYLGADLPMEDLHHAAETVTPDLICVSAIYATTIRQNLSALEKMNQIVAVGGSCVAQLMTENTLASSRVFPVGGSLPSVISQLELLMQASVRVSKVSS